MYIQFIKKRINRTTEIINVFKNIRQSLHYMSIKENYVLILQTHKTDYNK